MTPIILLSGCSARKNSTGTRAYHELTTRYNIYFNAEETYNEILKERSENLTEDYAELLPFYPTLSASEKSITSGPFDAVIEKTEKAIREHSITTKPKRDPSKAQSQEYREWLNQEEFNPFLKNVWLLRGKAYLQNGNYDEALSVFSGMQRIYSHDKQLLDETEIWMLRTYTEMGRMYEAEKTTYALRNKKLPEHLEKLYSDHYTYYLIRKKEFSEAIPHLRKAIKQEPDHSRKKDLQFLLGQLYAVTGEKNRAYQAFEEVKGLRTPFELTLNATLWQSALATGGEQRKVMRQLEKMAQKTSSMDSTTFANQRYQVYLKAGNDSLAQAFKPVTQGDSLNMATSTMIAVNDSTDNILVPQGIPQRFSEGRTLAENAALHRQWRFRNGVTQSQADAPSIPFSAGKDGAHYLLLTFTPGSTDKNQLIFATADFNFSHFKLRKFNLSHVVLPASEALQIEPFRSFEEASRYMEIMHDDSLFLSTLSERIIPVIISEENLQIVRSGKRMDEYQAFYAENYAPSQPVLQLEKRDQLMEEFEEKNRQEAEKIVSLETPPITTRERQAVPAEPEQLQKVEREVTVESAPLLRSERETPEALKRRLEENAAKALQQQQGTVLQKERQQSVKERQRERQERIKQRERELKQRQRQREAELKQREKERAKKIREQ